MSSDGAHFVVATDDDFLNHNSSDPKAALFPTSTTLNPAQATAAHCAGHPWAPNTPTPHKTSPKSLTRRAIIPFMRTIRQRARPSPLPDTPPTRIRRRGLEKSTDSTVHASESSRPRCARSGVAAAVAVVDQRHPSINARSLRRCQHKAARTSRPRVAFTLAKGTQTNHNGAYRSYPYTFRNVSTAVQVTGTAVPSQLLLNVVEGAQTLLANESELFVRARHNWWGPPEDGPVEVRMVSEVDWQPRLFTDPRTAASFGPMGSYPNPFNGTTVIDYSLSVDGEVKLVIYDILGREIATLVSTNQNAGSHSVKWLGQNNQGIDVVSGIYFYKLTFGTQTSANAQSSIIKRMVYLR